MPLPDCDSDDGSDTEGFDGDYFEASEAFEADAADDEQTPVPGLNALLIAEVRYHKLRSINIVRYCGLDSSSSKGEMGTLWV